MTDAWSAASDVELLRGHLDGDPDAFGVLVRRHQDRLWAVAVRTLGDRDEAADAVQDALISALRAAGSFRGEAAVSTWLHRIVVNACLDRARRRQARPTVPLPPDDRAPAAPGDDLGRAELAIDIERALAALPLEQRAALVLVDVQRFPVEEAAALLDVPVGTVKSRCSRGRAKLARLLGDQPDDRAQGTAGNAPAAGGVETSTGGRPEASATGRSEVSGGPDE
ncbi:MAG: RNA polymerase sigma factor SigM [Frankiaceae bacterium]